MKQMLKYVITRLRISNNSNKIRLGGDIILLDYGAYISVNLRRCKISVCPTDVTSASLGSSITLSSPVTDLINLQNPYHFSPIGVDHLSTLKEIKELLV